MSKNELPMGPRVGGPRTHFFALFEPRGTPGDPQGSQRSPRSPKQASKRQFGAIFTPFFTHFRPIFATFFRTFRLRFSHVFYSFLSTVAQQHTQQKGILSVTGQQPTQQKGILSVRQQADNLHSKRATQHSRRPTTNVPCTPLRHAAQACWQLHCTQHATTMPALLTEIRAQSSNHKVTKQGTVAGLPAGQLDNTPPS